MRETQATRYRKYLQLLRSAWRERPQYQAYLNLMLTLATISVFALFAIRPTLLVILELTRQIRAQTEVRDKLDKKLVSLSQAQQKWNEVQQDLSIISQALPDTPLPEQWGRQIEVLAAQDNISLINLSAGEVILVGKEKPKTQASKLPLGVRTFSVSLNSEGGPESAFSFLSNLSQMRRPVLFQTITLSGRPPAQAITLRLAITGALPYFKP